MGARFVAMAGMVKSVVQLSVLRESTLCAAPSPSACCYSTNFSAGKVKLSLFMEWRCMGEMGQ